MTISKKERFDLKKGNYFSHILTLEHQVIFLLFPKNF